MIDRKGHAQDGPIQVLQPFLSILSGVQPTVLECLQQRARGRALDDGLLDRFLFSYPEVQPMRGQSWHTLSAEAQHCWERTVQQVRRLSPTPTPGRWHARGLPLAPAARPLWEDITAAHAAEMNADEFPPGLRGPWVKLHSYLARLALIRQALACVWDQAADDGLEPAAVEASAQLVDYFKAHARKVYAMIGRDPGVERAERVLAWLRRHTEVRTFSRTDVWHALRKSFTHSGELTATLTLLQESNYLHADGPSRWCVNAAWTRSE